jgi:hypothetical protein
MIIDRQNAAAVLPVPVLVSRTVRTRRTTSNGGIIDYYRGSIAGRSSSPIVGPSDEYDRADRNAFCVRQKPQSQSIRLFSVSDCTELLTPPLLSVFAMILMAGWSVW